MWYFSILREEQCQRGSPERDRAEADRNNDSQQDQGQTQRDLGEASMARAGSRSMQDQALAGVCARLPIITTKEGAWSVEMFRMRLWS